MQIHGEFTNKQGIFLTKSCLEPGVVSDRIVSMDFSDAMCVNK